MGATQQITGIVNGQILSVSELRSSQAHPTSWSGFLLECSGAGAVCGDAACGSCARLVKIPIECLLERHGAGSSKMLIVF